MHGLGVGPDHLVVVHDGVAEVDLLVEEVVVLFIIVVMPLAIPEKRSIEQNPK